MAQRYTYQELRDEIERRGMRQRVVAERAGMPAQDLSRMLSLDPDGTASEPMSERVLDAIKSLALGVPA